MTRPQIFAGVSYTFFVINLVVCVELFLLFRSFWVLAVGGAIHIVGMLLSLEEPRLIDLWLTRMRTCPRVKNYGFWRCNSYRP